MTLILVGMFPDYSHFQPVLDSNILLMVLLMEKLSQGDCEYLLWHIQQKV